MSDKCFSLACVRRLAPARAWSPSLPVILLALAASARADVYVLADAQGVLHFSNAPENPSFRRISSLMEEAARGNRAGAPVLKRNAEAVAPHVDKAAEALGVDAALVHAVITAESGYNPVAVSRAGAQGLMQLMPATARRYAVKDVFDPEQNIDGGTRYLRDLLDMFDNNVELAVAAYNAGENAVKRYGNRVPPYRETQAYVPKVLRLYNQYAALAR
jgi:soluble lytic murein transglycosylase-like protein